jgi:flavin-dependent dehydrogenase
MNDPLPPAAGVPAHCDVIVVGAGPAGSACARVLARAGGLPRAPQLNGAPR